MWYDAEIYVRISEDGDALWKLNNLKLARNLK